MDLKQRNIGNQIILFVLFVLIGTLSRYYLFDLGIQPFPNFEIIMVLTFLAIFFLHPGIAFLVPLVSMIGSDLLIGNPIFVGSQMNQIVLFTYSGFLLIALVNTFYRDKIKSCLHAFSMRSVGLIAGLGIGFVLLYDVWTNFGWWYLIYPHTVQTLGVVFVAGIPFMIYHLVSGITTFIVIAVPIIYLSSRKSTDGVYEVSHIQKLPAALTTMCLIILSFIGWSW